MHSHPLASLTSLGETDGSVTPRAGVPLQILAADAAISLRRIARR
ncbi:MULTISPECIES: hypothetical protein [unclassified Synechococcus]|nr:MULTISPECIES: hypothetical protein [unclassified Synechococcus]